MNIRTYSELIQIPTLEERFRYLKLPGRVGVETFGFDRYLNQEFYKSDEWLSVRDFVILRDTGNNDYCQDLGMEFGYDIHGIITVHHMNPITADDIIRRSRYLLDPEFLICTANMTHKAIHYADETMLARGPIIRTRNDTSPWRH